jgi:hypothetical protein
MNRTKKYLSAGILAVAMMVCGISQASAAVIYSDSFSGSSATELNGSTPSITTGGATWIASGEWLADGSVSTTFVSPEVNTDVVAYLPFTPTSGNIYELSLTGLTVTGSSTGWVSLAFLQNTDSFGFFGTKTNPSIIRRSSAQTYFPSSYTTFGSSTGSIRIYLDTREANWTTALLLNGSTTPDSIFTYTSGNPNINYIGMTGTTDGSGTLVGNAYNFQLQTIPEPSTYAMLLVGGAGLMLVIRRRGARA